MLSKQGIETFLKRQDVRVVVLDELVSTNSYAVDMARETNQITAIIARNQTGGRGTRGRTFFCRANQGLYLSILFKPEMGLEKTGLITPAAGVAVARALKSAAGVDVKIKWVNDVVIDDKKLCGILAESRLAPGGHRLEYAVVGMGINLFVNHFPPEFADLATSLHRHSAAFDPNKLAAHIIDNLCGLLDEPNNDAFMEEYRRLSSVLGRWITFESGGGSIAGLAVEINRQGNLVVEAENDRRYILTAGNVSVRLEK